MVSNLIKETLASLCLFVFLPLIFLLFTFHRRRRTTLNLPPGPPPLPIIGNLLSIGKIPHISLHLLSQKYGPLIQLHLGQIPTILISDADNASEILKSQDHIFCNRKQTASLKRLSYGGKDIAFSHYDDNWKQLRRLGTQEVFSPNKVLSFESIRREEVEILLKTISTASSGGEPINMSEILICFFNNVIFREVFGKRISADGECGTSPLQNMLRELVILLNEFGAADLFPSLGWIDLLTGWRGNLDKVFKKMDFFLEESIKERLLVIKRDGRREMYFLDTLLNLQNTKDGASLSIDQIKAILMDLIIAGTDTSAATIEWAMANLIRNECALKRAQEEVWRVVAGKEKVRVNDLQHLHYLKLVIKETLRLNPPIPLLPPRESMKDTKINGYDILAKTMVYVNVWSIGRDPKYWKDPELFMPERFENSLVNFKGSDFELIPFGGGRRICPGLALGLANIELCLANLLHEFDWEFPNGMTKEDIEMGSAPGMVSPKRTPLILVAKPALNK
ncbi:cytochrome P450 71A1-like [Dendrobium catenatum]|uniref:Cytochrome P450 71A1 n=1 Tax=Dendrobium catenatum TaxID=906689 RepID=A0A2I0W6V4_9ASPA|nr:cytochrome P450 71A1-like [Dendrobium catenatum]PKU71388.1 Cytochrome P450 71A1 [Dendrobium catenatum]